MPKPTGGARSEGGVLGILVKKIRSRKKKKKKKPEEMGEHHRGAEALGKIGSRTTLGKL